MKVAIFDYGAGNIFSLKNSLEKNGAEVDIITGFDNLQKYSQIFKIEELSDLMAELMKRTKLAVELPREQNYGPLFQLSGLSDDAFEYLLDFYKQDYDLLANQYTLESIKSEYFSQKK
mgnify:CR=1 FL=1